MKKTFSLRNLRLSMFNLFLNHVLFISLMLTEKPVQSPQSSVNLQDDLEAPVRTFTVECVMIDSIFHKVLWKAACSLSHGLQKKSGMTFCALHLCSQNCCRTRWNHHNILPLTSTSIRSPQVRLANILLSLFFFWSAVLSGSIQWKHREGWQSWCEAVPAQRWVSL